MTRTSILLALLLTALGPCSKADPDPKPAPDAGVAAADSGSADAGAEPRILARANGEIRDQYLDAARARTELGWQPQVALADGLAATVTWYRTFFACAVA